MGDKEMERLHLEVEKAYELYIKSSSDEKTKRYNTWIEACNNFSKYIQER